MPAEDKFSIVLTRRSMFAIIIAVAAPVLLWAVPPIAGRSNLLWLLAVFVPGPWAIWHLARQLYTAAMHGYVVTGVPEKRVYRDDAPSLYRNNVIAYIILFPIVAAGVVIMMLNALQAEHLIR
ncbi:hypothetical protein LZK98_00575 [Sphingomonas cannabina]|uniref:hypothetical protein n=1 Tax=Sphingomonas cannabina TaxID=2899123 RepID=UPI001F36C367|nr:hypothetical protein [Sphingomonas cannabina]UIJ45493.1 hypothetical protein LZK98_00575 [Sphingomonas cannabina]